MGKWFIFLLLFIPLLLQAETDYYREQIRKRISPIGTVRTEEAAPVAQPEAKTAETQAPEAASPGTVYEKFCSVCHRAGVAGAPKFRDEGDWQSRLAEKGMDGVTATAMTGIGAMPPKGTCSECSEKEIREVVEYMVPQS